MEAYLPVGNSFDVEVPTLTDADTGDAVTDAVLTCTVKDIDGVVVAGCDGVALTHRGAGTYRGRLTPTTDLIDGASYEVVVESAAYTLAWSDWPKAWTRNFER